MSTHLRANLWLLVLTVLLCSVLYPLVLLGSRADAVPRQAQGSLLTDAEGKPIGSRLIAQPFVDAQGNTADEYFQPRPSAASYNAAASAASNWSGNNYQLRDRVARQLGPIVKYASGPKAGQPVAADVESWFQKDQFDGKPGIVAQWASLHSGVAGSWLHDWVKADKLNAAYVAAWEAANPSDVTKWKNDNNSPIPSRRTWPQASPGGSSPASRKTIRARFPASQSMRRMERRRRPSALSRKAATFNRCSSTCGSRSTPTRTCNEFPPTW